jgi:nucleoside-diphosphate-sugar epimerase
MTARVLISGASGALGATLTRELARDEMRGAEIVALFRSELSYRQVMEAWFGAERKRVRAVFCDLTDAASVQSALNVLEPVERSVGIHCAADVSWSKSMDLVAPLNVGGTLAFAGLLSARSERAGLIYISSAYTGRGRQHFNNAYEESKALADELVRQRFPKLAMTTASCSLILGAAADGAIYRFNGIYPLVRLIATAAVPALVVEKSFELDVVPVDWVVDELLHLLDAHLAGAACADDVVLSATGARLGLRQLNDVTAACTNRLRAARGLTPAPLVGIISPRQRDFLMRASVAWGMSDRFYHLERYYGILRQYVELSKTGEARERQNVRRPPPDVASYLLRAVDYWLARNEQRALRIEQPTWSAAQAPESQPSTTGSNGP